MENVQTKQGTRFIDGPEGTLFLNDAGNGNPPIVFAHSFAGSSLQWRHQLDFFRQHYRTIAFDFRNHGQSAAPVEADTFAAEEIADDIAAVIDHLNLPGFILVGHSMGGAAAIAYARRNTDRVAALVMVGTPGTTPPEQGKAIVDSLKTDQYQRVMDQYMTRILTNAKPQTREMIMAGINMVDQERSTNIVKAMFEFDSVTALKGYPGPRLIISTAAEEQQPNTLHKQNPDIPHKLFEGTSHWTMLDKPDEFNAILMESIEVFNRTGAETQR